MIDAINMVVESWPLRPRRVCRVTVPRGRSVVCGAFSRVHRPENVVTRSTALGVGRVASSHSTLPPAIGSPSFQARSKTPRSRNVAYSERSCASLTGKLSVHTGMLS